jgi:hypothetical protein
VSKPVVVMVVMVVVVVVVVVLIVVVVVVVVVVEIVVVVVLLLVVVVVVMVIVVVIVVVPMSQSATVLCLITFPLPISTTYERNNNAFCGHARGSSLSGNKARTSHCVRQLTSNTTICNNIMLHERTYFQIEHNARSEASSYVRYHHFLL